MYNIVFRDLDHLAIPHDTILVHYYIDNIIYMLREESSNYFRYPGKKQACQRVGNKSQRNLGL